MTSNSIPIHPSNLEALSKKMAVPRYDRQALRAGIVHIGAGGFNRAHLAVYLDDLLNEGGDPRWAECGIGLLPPDVRIHEGLAAQDGLYSVLAWDADHQDLRIVGSLVKHLYAPAAIEATIEKMASPECSIVSLTVTEGGYFIEDSSKQFLDSDPGIQFDLAHPSEPKTFLGYLAEAANRRRKRGVAPFTIMSCDNLQGNGKAARTALLAFSGMRDAGLRRWIEENVAFPSSMVDRITPTTTDEDREFLESHFGVRDLSPVVTEPFRQWIIEDTFSDGRPPWESVGVQLTSDVVPFERIKMRLLNGGHLTIAYAAVLLGIPLVSQAMEDGTIRKLLRQFLEQVTPILPELPGMELAGYKAEIIHRFSNPTIKDTILRLCLDSTAKIAKFIVPSIGELLKAGRKPEILPLVVACCLFSMCGKDEQGRSLAIVDPMAGLLSEFVDSGGKDANLALSVTAVFGDVALPNSRFAAQVQEALNSLREAGVRSTIERTISAASGNAASVGA